MVIKKRITNRLSWKENEEEMKIRNWLDHTCVRWRTVHFVFRSWIQRLGRAVGFHWFLFRNIVKKKIGFKPFFFFFSVCVHLLFYLSWIADGFLFSFEVESLDDGCVKHALTHTLTRKTIKKSKQKRTRRHTTGLPDVFEKKISFLLCLFNFWAGQYKNC